MALCEGGWEGHWVACTQVVCAHSAAVLTLWGDLERDLAQEAASFRDGGTLVRVDCPISFSIPA